MKLNFKQCYQADDYHIAQYDDSNLWTVYTDDLSVRIGDYETAEEAMNQAQLHYDLETIMQSPVRTTNSPKTFFKKMNNSHN